MADQLDSCLAIPVVALGWFRWNTPRTRWAFYAYYVGHLAVLGGFAAAL